VLRDYLGVKLPHTKCCDLHQHPLGRLARCVLRAVGGGDLESSRGLGGKSFTLAALGMAEALFLRADVNILGGSGEQSKRILESIGKLWEHPRSPGSA
jgi:hypothetical protein